MKLLANFLAALGVTLASVQSDSPPAVQSELDAQMKEVAEFFSGKIRGDHDVLFAKRLARDKLDLSVDSVRAVDEWVDVLRTHKVTSDSAEAAESLVWAGAYVGEVIRACAKKRYTWMRYADYMSDQPQNLRNLIPYTFGSQFMLVAATSGMTMPLNKVVRALEEGPENNLHFYVSAECKR